EGLLLRGDGRGNLSVVSGETSGLHIHGEQRGAAVSDFDLDGRLDHAVGQNAAQTRLFRNRLARPGLRVLFEGPLGNPCGVGVRARLKFRECQAGSGWWSQNSCVLVLGMPSPPSELVVQWPGGALKTYALSPSVAEVTVSADGKLRIHR